MVVYPSFMFNCPELPKVALRLKLHDEVRPVQSPWLNVTPLRLPAVTGPNVLLAFIDHEHVLPLCEPRTTLCGLIFMTGAIHCTESGTVFQLSVMFICPLVPMGAEILNVQDGLAAVQFPALKVAPLNGLAVRGPLLFVAVTVQLQVLPVWLPNVNVSGFSPRLSPEQLYGIFEAKYWQ
jgi:hypothetical protein